MSRRNMKQIENVEWWRTEMAARALRATIHHQSFWLLLSKGSKHKVGIYWQQRVVEGRNTRCRQDKRSEESKEYGFPAQTLVGT
jgi:hypothetical protein